MSRRTSSPRVVVLGLDGVPVGLVDRLVRSGDMPHLAALLEQGAMRPMRSTLPTISSVAWSSFMTGANPGIHGIFGFTDLRPGTYETTFNTFRQVRAPTGWDVLARQGKRAVVINVPNTYPARPMEGVLIAGFVAPDLKKAVFPPALADWLGGIGYRIDVDYQQAAQKRDAFFQDLAVTLERRREVILHLLEREAWDLFIGVFTETDRLMHFFYGDFEHDGTEASRFVQFYRRLDEIIGEIAGRPEVRDSHLLLVADHGFCALTKEVHVNTWLMQEGYLRPAATLPARLSDLAPGSRAFCLDPGRIYLNVRGRFPGGTVTAGAEADALRQELADRLANLADAETGHPMIERVFVRDEIYDGPAAVDGPDLVLHGHRGYDLKGALGRPEIVGRGHFTGMHTFDDALLYYRGGRDLEIPDISAVMPAVLGFLDVPIAGSLEGVPRAGIAEAAR